MLGSNSRRWIVSSKILISAPLFSVLVAFLMSAFAATAQEVNTRPAEMSRTAKSSENNSITADSELQLNIHRPTELAKSESKINKLLTSVRTALLIESNAVKFHENLEQSIRTESEQVCPVIPLVDLIKGSTLFIASPETDNQELRHAIDLLTILLNELSAK